MEFVQAMDDQAAADPQHRGGAHDRQYAHQDRHRLDQAAPDRTGHGGGAGGQMEADIVHLHDEADNAIDARGNQDGDDDEDERLFPDRFGCDGAERNGHDLARQDEVGADRARHFLVFKFGRVKGFQRFLGDIMAALHGLQQLFRRFIAQECAAQHEERGQQPGRDRADQQRSGQQEEQLVAQRSLGDFPDDRQFAVGGEAHDIARGDGGIVDDHARGLGARLARGGGDIVQRGRGQLNNARHIIEQRDQTRRHRQ